MKDRTGAPWRQLAPVALVVLAVHLVLLQGGPQLLRSRPEPVRFVSRSIAPASPPPRTAGPVAPAGPPAGAAGQLPRAAAAPAAPAAAPATPPQVPAPAQAPAPAAAPHPTPANPPAPLSTELGLELPAAEPLPPVAAIPDPARLHYQVEARTHGFTLRGEGRLDWRHDGQRYDARLEISGLGLPSRVQHSTGRIGADGLAPEYFSDKGARSEQATHFDRAGGRVIFSSNQPQAALAEGMQDRLSVVVQLSVLVAGQPAKFPPGTQIAIPTASTREAETWIFRVEGEEDIDLPGGPLRALRLQRLPRKPYDQQVDLWLAPRMDYAPVRLRLTNPNGDTVDQRWSSTDRG